MKLGAGDSGDESGLQGVLGPAGAFFVTVSCLSPSIAVFIVGDDVIRHVGTGIFLCFAAAAVFGVAMACVYGELGSAFPGSGGEYSILLRVFGPTWAHGVLGLNMLGFCISLALSGFGVATYLGVVWPDLPSRALAAALVAVVTGLAILRVEVGTFVTGAFLLTELLALTILAVLGMLHIHQPVTALFRPAIAMADGALQTPTLAALAAATAVGIYAFNGYGAAIFFGEDMRNARRDTARVVFAALAAGVVMVMLPVGFLLLGTGDLHDLAATPGPISAFVERRGGRGLSHVMTIGVALAVFNAMIAIALMGGRQLYATGRDGLWPPPVSRALAAVHSRWRSPWVATLVTGGAGLLACLLDPHVLVLILGSSNILTYASLCSASFQARRTGASAEDAWRMPLFPWTPIAALGFLATLSVSSLSDRDERVGLALTLLTFCVAAVASKIWRRQASRL